MKNMNKMKRFGAAVTAAMMLGSLRRKLPLLRKRLPSLKKLRRKKQRAMSAWQQRATAMFWFRTVQTIPKSTLPAQRQA